jgi:hypothetical protein
MYLYPNPTIYSNLVTPLINWANANVETFARFAQSTELTELTRTNTENFWEVVTRKHRAACSLTCVC